MPSKTAKQAKLMRAVAHNDPYAIAKITGIKISENYYREYESNFYSVMPTNMYGPNDNFDLNTSHVLPAFIRKFHEAKEKNKSEIVIWGSGKPLREFLLVEDLADTILFLMEKVDAKDLYENGISHLNIGAGKDLTILELAKLVAEIIGFKGKIVHDLSKPDGTPRKLLDVSRINSLGWKHRTELQQGIVKTYHQLNARLLCVVGDALVSVEFLVVDLRDTGIRHKLEAGEARGCRDVHL